MYNLIIYKHFGALRQKYRKIPSTLAFFETNKTQSFIPAKSPLYSYKPQDTYLHSAFLCGGTFQIHICLSR